MKAPMYVRAVSPAEQTGIAAGLRSSDAFTLRRSQILLASSREQRPAEIARNLGCAIQTVLLSRKDWIASSKSPADRKRCKLSLTRPNAKRYGLSYIKVRGFLAK